METIGQARRRNGIPEADYLRDGDTPDRISTIRCLARVLGAPDSRTEHPDSCQLHWYTEARRTIVVKPNGSITN